MLNFLSTLGSRPPSLSFQGTFLERGQDNVIAGIEERIARWTLLPVGNGEGLQVGGGAWGAAHCCFFVATVSRLVCGPILLPIRKAEGFEAGAVGRLGRSECHVPRWPRCATVFRLTSVPRSPWHSTGAEIRPRAEV